MQRKIRVRLLSAAFLLFLSIFAISCYSYGPSDRLFTPIPTLIPVDTPNPLDHAVGAAAVISCPVRPVDLLGAWVTAGYSATEPFEFTSEDGKTCVANFVDDVQKLFLQSNLWYEGAPACASCHTSNLETAMQHMDLSSYEGILAGSQRQSADQKGNDILGGGNWEASKLYYMLINRLMPLGRPADSPEKGPVIFSGKLKSE